MPGSSAWASLTKFIRRNELHPCRANHRYPSPDKTSHTPPRQQWRGFYCLSRAGNTLCSRIEQTVTDETQMALLVLTELLTAIRAKDAQWLREWLEPRSTPLD